MSQLCIELIKGTFTLLAVGLGSWIALGMYFRQKEYELVKQRYLEGGVDVVATQLEGALGVVSHNYGRCLQVCKSMRDAKADFDLKELDTGFLELDTSSFQQIAHHRINSLLNSDVLWMAYQLALAYATTANSRITNEMTQAIRMRYTTDRIKQNYQSIAEIMITDLTKLQDESFQYATIIRELHALSLMLEAERMNLKAIAKFHKRPAVTELVERLRSAFSKDLNPAATNAQA